MTPAPARGRLFRKYVVVFVLLVGGVLLISSAVDLHFSYQETKTALIRIEREQAVAAAARIEQFVVDIERQIRWTTQAAFDDPAAAREQREIDYLRLLRNVPAIGEIRHLDASGKEQLRVSRLALDAIGSQEDRSGTREFQGARGGTTHYGAVYFRNESEPYMAIAVPAGEYGVEVTVAEVNLKAIWDVVSRIRIGTAGYAYVVDVLGHLVAHPDISLVLQKRDLSALPQVRSARAARPGTAGDEAVGMVGAGLQGGQFLTAYAPIAPLGWLVFVEQPLAEAFAPLQASIIRSGVLFALGLALSVLASVLLARRMVAPIRALREGAARIGAGELGHRLEVRTGDELEALGEEFNRTAARLQESYAGLEEKVEARTRELRQALDEVRALSDVSQAVSSTLDLPTVLATIVNRATHLSGADAGVIYEYDEVTTEFRLRATENLDEPIVQILRTAPLRMGESTTGRAAAARRPVEIADISEADMAQNRVREAYVGAGYRAFLAVPLLREDEIVGALTIARKAAGTFPAATLALIETFAAQSVLAIQNARLFREIADKSRQLEVASRHKSEFLASMSHELRTPLNAILGFNEMILADVYGEVPTDLREPLTDIQNSGKHLLRLINNVLDLAKIEAGRMELAPVDYSVQDTVERVRASLRPLAADKGLEFVTAVPDDVPLAHGDAGRITQCLMNLAGNAIKFTREGRVEIAVGLDGDRLVYRVTDTGIGIAPDKIPTLFSEFRQGDATIASQFGGTGLGLSITKKFVEMHGGQIWAESQPGKGSTFAFAIPLRLDGGKAA